MSYAIFVGSVQSLILPDGPVASARPPLRFSALDGTCSSGLSFNQLCVSVSVSSLMNPSTFRLFSSFIN